MKTTDEVLKFTRTISFKFILIGILSLFLLIPSAWIRGLVIERQKRSLEVVKEISSSWGEAQYFTGPVLTIPYTRYIEKDGKINIQKEYAHFLPSELSISGEIDPVIRYRGIYKVAVYNTLLKTDAIFEKPDLESLGIDPANTDLKNAYISVGISDMRGIKNDVVVNWMNKSLQVYPGIPERDIISSGFHSMADLDTSELPDKIPFSVSISLNGSNSLNFYPIGKTTKVNINSSWSDPAFEGNFLPNERNITDAGFQASWMVTHLNRNYPQSWINNGYKIEGSDFGVGLFLPVSHYQKSERSAKYALMFIGLTFLIFLLIEILNRKRLHPVQYLLTGLSLSVFYSLLVSLSEQIGFGYAYLVSAFAIVILISLYIHNGFHFIRYTLITAAVLSLLYGYLYIVLQLEDYSLLFGSIGLFMALAIFMYLTRKINWYKEESISGEQETGS